MAVATPLRYLLDTSIVIVYLGAGDLARRIEAIYALRTTPVVPLISVVTEGELESAARQFGWGKERQRELRILIGQFQSISLGFPGIIEAYGEIDDYSRRLGRVMGKNDVWIAATAHVTSARLLTLDRDFDHLDPSFLTHDYIDPDPTA
jgi:tRNA(fMet)-specific endonuclease VapC